MNALYHISKVLVSASLTGPGAERGDRTFKGFFNRPSSMQTRTHRSPIKTQVLNPLSESTNLSVKIYNAISASIITLLLHSRPSAIMLRVRTTVFDPFNRCITFAIFFGMIQVRGIHVITEFFKRIPEYFNSSTAVERISSIRFADASGFCFGKNLIESSLSHPMSLIRWHMSPCKTHVETIPLI